MKPGWIKIYLRLWTLGFCSVLVEEIKFPFHFCLVFYFHANVKKMLLRHSTSIPHMRARRTFGRKKKKRDENGNNRKAVAVYFDAFALIAIILTSNTRGKLWKKGK